MTCARSSVTHLLVPFATLLALAAASACGSTVEILSDDGTGGAGGGQSVPTSDVGVTTGTATNAATATSSAISTTSTGGAGQTPPTEGLVGWWRFDDLGPKVKDSSGNGNDGLAQGNVTQVPGRVGLAYSLTGGCIGVPNSSSLAMDGGNQVTMMAWIEPATECAADNCEFVNKEYTYEMAQGAGTVAATGDQPWESIPGAFGEAIMRADGTWFWNEKQPNVIVLDTWQHVAVTWDGTTVTRYLDGAVLADPTNPRVLDSSLSFAGKDTGLGIGCRNVAADGTIVGMGAQFTGIIDEAAVYDRALTPAEIATYYAATK